MILDHFEIYITKSIDTAYLLKTINSLYRTVPNDQVSSLEFKIVSEKKCHEDTLNDVLRQSNPDKDVLIVADDIVFKEGWLESLEQHYHEGDIIGFSMLKPGSNKLLDFGYDFIILDDELSYKSFDKGKLRSDVSLAPFRECDAVCGCCMLIKKAVKGSGLLFRPEGMQRWSEMIFSYQAKQNGFKTIVLSSHLEHFGISSKQSGDLKLSSMSWIVESQLWKSLVKQFLTDVLPKKRVRRIVSKRLHEWINNQKALCLYGCGSISDFMMKQYPDIQFSVCAGLPEEINQQFNGVLVTNVEDMDWQGRTVINTAIGYDQQIFKIYFSEVADFQFICLSSEENKNADLLIDLGSLR